MLLFIWILLDAVQRLVRIKEIERARALLRFKAGC